MELFWKTVGSLEIYSKLIDKIESNEKLLALEGYSGSGKSWMLKALCLHWEESGGCPFYFEGNSSSFLVSYSVLNTGLKSFDPALSLRKSLPKVLGMSIDSLLRTRGVFTELLSLSNVSGSKSITACCPAYDTDTASILESMDIKSSNKPILIVADAIHLWDSKSLGLLFRVIESIPLLDERITVVLSNTVDQKTNYAESKAIVEELMLKAKHKYKLPILTENNFREGLVSLGLAEKTPVDVTDSLYAICGNHLPSICKSIELINSRSNFHHIETYEDIYSALIRDKNAKQSSEIIDVLTLASIIGQSFSKNELNCALDKSNGEVSKFLSAAKNLNFLTIENEICSFSHDSFFLYFKRLADSNHTPEIYEKLDYCFAQLRPNNYLMRAVISYKCSNFYKACHLAIVQASEDCRRFGYESLSDINFLHEKDVFEDIEVINEIKNNNLFEILISFVNFWKELRKNNFEDALESIIQVRTEGVLLLEAEKDYCLSSLYLATRNSDSRESSDLLLSRLPDLKEQEPYLWTKLSFNHLYVKSLDKNREEAKNIARNIENHLIARTAFDSTSKDELHVLYRVSFAYYPKQLAELRNKDALQYFENQHQNGECSRLDEFLRTMNNQATVELKKEKWKKSLELLNKSISIYHRLFRGRFNNPEFIYSNQYIAELLSENLSSKTVANNYNRLVKDGSKINLLVMSNAIGANLVASQLDIANELLDQTKPLWDDCQLEPFVYYLFRTHVAMSYFLNGEKGIAIELWEGLNEVVKNIPYSSSQLYIKRHSFIGEILKNVSIKTLSELNECLEVKTELPPYYRQSIFLSIILYWKHA